MWSLPKRRDNEWAATSAVAGTLWAETPLFDSSFEIFIACPYPSLFFFTLSSVKDKSEMPEKNALEKQSLTIVLFAHQSTIFSVSLL